MATQQAFIDDLITDHAHMFGPDITCVTFFSEMDLYADFIFFLYKIKDLALFKQSLDLLINNLDIIRSFYGYEIYLALHN